MRAALDAWAGEGRGEQGGGKGGCDSTPKKKEPKKEWCRGLLVDGLFFWFRKDRLHFSSLRRRKEAGWWGGGEACIGIQGQRLDLMSSGRCLLREKLAPARTAEGGRGEICIISREKTACSMLPD